MLSSRLVWRMLLILQAGELIADDAVDRKGQRRVGDLASDHFTVRATGKKLPVADLRSVTFASQPTPLPKVPATLRLHLRTGETLSGQLLRCDAKQVEFHASFGLKRTFDRSEVVGIEQPDGFLRVIAQSPDEGKRSKLEAAGQTIERTWKPAIEAGRITVAFHDEAGDTPLGWQLELRLEGKEPIWLACFHADGANVTTPDDWRRRSELPRGRGMRLLQVDFADERCRVHVDDLLLGENNAKSPLRVTGVRLQAVAGKAGVVQFDQLDIAKQGQGPPRFEANAEADVLLLPGGAQYLGAIERADEQGVVFVGRAGKQSFMWSQLHGFAFKGASLNEVKPAVEVRFRPAPGVSPDRLFGTAIRVVDGDFLLAHPTMDEIRLSRDRLDRLTFHDRK